MSLTSQDLIKGIDISGLSSVSASEFMQLVDAGRTANDKGLTIVTTDSALNTPVVPNPDVVLEGVTPIWWKRYIWIRKPFDATGIIALYAWNDNIASDPTYLQWQTTNTNIDNLTTRVDTLSTSLDGAEVNIDSLQSSVSLINTSIAGLSSNVVNNNHSIEALQNALNAIWPIGSYRTTARNEGDSGNWCLADGRALNRVTFGALFTAIATVYGAGDGVNTFNIPDCRSRMLIGASRNGSVPAGLTQRIPGVLGGEETHLLTGPESGIQSHAHIYDLQPSAGDQLNLGTTYKLHETDLTVDTAFPKDAVDSHNIMNPFAPGFIMIRIA